MCTSHTHTLTVSERAVIPSAICQHDMQEAKTFSDRASLMEASLLLTDPTQLSMGYSTGYFDPGPTTWLP